MLSFDHASRGKDVELDLPLHSAFRYSFIAIHLLAADSLSIHLMESRAHSRTLPLAWPHHQHDSWCVLEFAFFSILHHVPSKTRNGFLHLRRCVLVIKTFNWTTTQLTRQQFHYVARTHSFSFSQLSTEPRSGTATKLQRTVKLEKFIRGFGGIVWCVEVSIFTIHLLQAKSEVFILHLFERCCHL